jgi:3-oxoacyl-[acyl-carrier protein] reductase
LSSERPPGSHPIALPDSTALRGKVAIVLGGSGGIGAATARWLAASGASVVVTWRNGAAAANALVAELPPSAGPAHAALPASIEDSASLHALAHEVEQRFGRADILVNSAGFTQPIAHGDLEALDDALIDRMFAVNWRGQFAAVRVFQHMLAAHGDGLVVNISSIAALNGMGSNLAYCAVKAGIDAMTKSLARALAPAIRVMAVSPGMVATGFVAGRDAAFNARAAGSIPLGRVAEADDVARAVLACATLLTYSTGSLILVDGGRAL